jgi:hypothetical protein
MSRGGVLGTTIKIAPSVKLQRPKIWPLVMAVERELRPSVEHQVRQELSQKEGRKKDALEIHEKGNSA